MFCFPFGSRRLRSLLVFPWGFSSSRVTTPGLLSTARGGSDSNTRQYPLLWKIPLHLALPVPSKAFDACCYGSYGGWASLLFGVLVLLRMVSSYWNRLCILEIYGVFLLVLSFGNASGSFGTWRRLEDVAQLGFGRHWRILWVGVDTIVENMSFSQDPKELCWPAIRYQKPLQFQGIGMVHRFPWFWIPQRQPIHAIS